MLTIHQAIALSFKRLGACFSQNGLLCQPLRFWSSPCRCCPDQMQADASASTRSSASDGPPHFAALPDIRGLSHEPIYSLACRIISLATSGTP